jgi:hypothetical protein
MSPTHVSAITSDGALSALSESSRACIERLCKHEPERFELTDEYVLQRFRADAPLNPFLLPSSLLLRK